ncbi:MAG TPA: competence/damage-inducible protein A [Bryobacteraceae bacterium]|jgi:nicotinamide-nucleotide amidase|nr:competence/damage-inducible protein A [Bryobacteraceae bacterium]
MQAEIIAVGSEMLTHKRVDTNSLFLTEHLNNLGVEVVAKHVIGDDRDRLAGEIRRALLSADFVVLSGGLGPTEDDLTRDAVALALDRLQFLNEEICESIEQRFRKMNRTMPEINRRQAMVIEGAEVLSNDRGTAPGQWIQDGDAIVIILPGPPHELKSMFTSECLPRLERIVPPAVIRTLEFRISGMSESELDQSIAPVYKPYDNPVTTILAHNGDMQVHLRARCASEAETMALLAEVGGKIEAILGERIYSRNGDALEAVIGKRLLARGATLAVAESVTGGGLAERISTVPGCSEWFLGGFITYSRRLKTELLGVPADLIERFGAVSKETAEAMAMGARDRTGATWAIGVTGNAGPTTDGDEAPVGMIIVALSGPEGTVVFERQWPASDRPRVRAFAAQMALDALCRKLAH